NMYSAFEPLVQQKKECSSFITLHIVKTGTFKRDQSGLIPRSYTYIVGSCVDINTYPFNSF
ncbi:hypothetical protein ACJMK2_027089, partial [Sinanodonta woodiana]